MNSLSQPSPMPAFQLTFDRFDEMVVRAGLSAASSVEWENESRDYGACRFRIGGFVVAFRVSKVTPTKVGEFVTLWKRPVVGGEIAPFDSTDLVDFVVVGAGDESERGYFVFARTDMIEHQVFSVGGTGGKRAFRVYPPWAKPTATAAVKTQLWQSKNFVPSGHSILDLERLSELLGSRDGVPTSSR